MTFLEKYLPLKNLSPALWYIGVLSFFWSVSSMMVFSVLPSYLSEELHASSTTIGLMEGVVMFACFAVKVISGALSDYWQKRKPFIVVGSACTMLVKSLFAVSTTVSGIFLARFIDRISKGIRSSPTDALTADIALKTQQGQNFGLRQSLCTMGAVIGGLVSTSLLHLTQHNYRLIFWISAIFASVAVFISIYFIRDVAKNAMQLNFWRTQKFSWVILKTLPRQYWVFLIFTGFLMMARFSEMFISLRAKDVGWSLENLPLIMVVMDITHSLVAYPYGVIADRNSRKKILFQGLLVLVLTDALFIYVNDVWGVLLGIVLAGLHMGMTQGLLKTIVSEYAPDNLRGSAFSLFYLVTGITLFLGNYCAGYLSDLWGTTGAFWGGGVFALIATIGLRFFYL